MTTSGVASALKSALREAERSRERHGERADAICAALSAAQSRLAGGESLEEGWLRDAIREAASWSGDDDLKLLASLGALARAMRESAGS